MSTSPEWEIAFEEKYVCNCILCNESGNEFSTTAGSMKEFIRNLLASQNAEHQKLIMEAEQESVEIGESRERLRIIEIFESKKGLNQEYDRYMDEAIQLIKQ